MIKIKREAFGFSFLAIEQLLIETLQKKKKTLDYFHKIITPEGNVIFTGEIE